MGLTHDGGLGLEPVSSIPGPKCFVQQSQSSELPASLSLHFARGKAEGVTGPLPSGIPQGLGVVRGGSCSCSIASSEFLQLINWPRCCWAPAGQERKEVGSVRGKGKRTRSWEKRLSETRSPQAEGGGVSDSSRANKHGGGEGKARRAPGLGPSFYYPPNPSKWASGIWEG